MIARGHVAYSHTQNRLQVVHTVVSYVDLQQPAQLCWTMIQMSGTILSTFYVSYYLSTAEDDRN